MTSVLLPDGSVRPALVPYLRVSTDDKGQDPKRQLASIAPWAEREGFMLLPPEEDEGTSASKVPALERPVFISACKRASAAQARGVVLEDPSRFSRMDPMLAVWEMMEVRFRYGLEVYFTCVPLSFQTSPWGRLMVFMQMGQAHQWVVEHTQKTVSGMERRRAQGVRFGRKPKDITDDELLYVVRRRAEGAGFEKLAVEINEMRGVHLLTDKAVAYRRQISSGVLRRLDAEGRFGQPDETLSVQSQDLPAETFPPPSETDESENGAVNAGVPR